MADDGGDATALPGAAVQREELWGVADICVWWGERRALDNVTLTVRPGEVAAVVGGGGAGKTTLLRVLTGRVVPSSGTVRTPPSQQIGYQPATSGSWAALTVRENLELVSGAYGIDPKVAGERRRELLSAAGLAGATERLAAQLSGGMRQKLGFCMAMMHQPELLVLDEPSTGVDPVSRVELWGLVSQAAARGAAVLMATTYLDEAERAHSVLVLDRGVPLLSGTPAEVVRAAPGSVTVVAQPDGRSPAWRRGRAWHAWQPAAPASSSNPPDLEDAVIAAAIARGRTLSGPVRVAARRSDRSDSSGALLRARSVTRLFGDLVAVQDASLAVDAGEIVGLIGANGAGKTTVIRMLLGLLKPSTGRVELFGRSPARETRQRLGYVPQSLGLYADLSVAENLAFVARAYGAELPRDVLVNDHNSLVASIGLGRQRQLAFAAALAHSPELLVLDEPTSGVDPLARADLWDTIRAEAESGVGVLVSTHYMQEAEQCDRLVLMDLGRVVVAGTVAQIVHGVTAVQVETADWTTAFAALTADNLPVVLSGTRIRIAGQDQTRIQATLAASRIDAALTVVPATLEEQMTIISRSRGSAVRTSRH